MRKAITIYRLQRRVQELEELICPCNQHKYIRTGLKAVYICGEVEFFRAYKCIRCGKEVTASEWEEEP